MPLFNLVCTKCAKKTRVLAPSRSDSLSKPCECGGSFDFKVNISTRNIEVLDNGLMERKVERVEGVEEMMKTRAEGPTEPDTV